MENQTIVFHPDSNYDFPATVKGGIKRKCNFKYFVDNNWLTYDISKDRVFGHVCKEGLRKKIITKNYQTIFMEEGVNDWKNAHSKFCWHEKSSIHIEAVSKLLENRNEKDISQNTNIQFCRYKIIFPWL